MVALFATNVLLGEYCAIYLHYSHLIAKSTAKYLLQNYQNETTFDT